MNTRSAILAAALGAAMLSAPTLAAGNSTGIRYADLNLSTPEGQAQLDRRIDNAAKEMCGITDIRTGTILQGTKQKQCYEAAKASAHKQIAARMAQQTQQGG
jgi:UrcA family protein